jgi:outer membrane protein OmpA-like peptidoglycan-associated protein
MFYRPLRSIGRFALAACAVSLSAACLNAQTPSTPPPASGPNPSRVDLFLGYSYYGAHGNLKPGNLPYSSVDVGAGGSIAYYFSKYFGMEGVVMAHPDGKNDGFFSASAGPIFRAPMQNYTLFAHGLAGGSRLGGPNSDVLATFGHNPYTWGVTLAAGGGMDYDLPFFNHAFSLRLFEADYRWDHTDFGYYIPPPTPGAEGGRANIPGVELSSGIVAHFGHIIPPPPVTYSCAVAPDSGYPGDPLTVTGTAMNLNPKKTASYTWTTDGGVVTGTSNVANIDTKNSAPGSYTAKGHVSEGDKAGMMADCSAPFTIKAFEPPTISCSASPSSIHPGDSATVTASGMSPQNRPLTYSYSATSGSISGNTSTAMLSTTSSTSGTITVTCNVVDDKGQTASSTTSVSVMMPPPPPPPPMPQTSALCSISFDRDARRPTRVDNEAKACLDEIALNLQRSTDAKVAVVGDAASGERESHRMAEERATNTKAYLVTEKGIDPSRIMVYTGTEDGKKVTSTLIPSGATMDANGDTMVDESHVHAEPRRAEHRRHHKKK